jgi:capping protein alpha
MSAEHIQKIANYFIMSSPTGEVDEVVTDVKKLAGDSALSSDAVKGMLRDYNIEQMTFGPDPDGNKCLVSAHGKVDDDLFLDPSSGVVMRFNHVTRKFVEVTDKKQVLSGAVAEYRSQIEESLKGYLEKCYKKNKVAACVYGADSGVVTVCISAANVNLGNFWTGGWKSVYQVDTSSEGEKELKGDVSVNVHYFEDGNVQLHTSFPSNDKVKVGDAKSTAAAVVKAIQDGESAFQNNLEEMYVEMHDNTFKSMRRFWPINKQPFNWNSAAHKMTEQLHGGA